jgi:hypothetical protein
VLFVVERLHQNRLYYGNSKNSSTREEIEEVSKAIRKSFFVPVAFKPNSLHQEELGSQLPGIPKIQARGVLVPSDYVSISLGSSVGRLRILVKIDEKTVIRPDEIIVLPEAPVDLPPVAGIITSQPASPLSHISLREVAVPKGRSVLTDEYVHNVAYAARRIQTFGSSEWRVARRSSYETFETCEW